MKAPQPKVGNTLDVALFSLATTKPHDAENLKYQSLGRYFGRNGYRSARRDYDAFCKRFRKFINSLDTKYFFDEVFYSWLVVEVSQIDGEPYAELSLSDKIFLPIAGKQLPIIERHARELDMSVVGFADSFNYILNNP